MQNKELQVYTLRDFQWNNVQQWKENRNKYIQVPHDSLLKLLIFVKYRVWTVMMQKCSGNLNPFFFLVWGTRYKFFKNVQITYRLHISLETLRIKTRIVAVLNISISCHEKYNKEILYETIFIYFTYHRHWQWPMSKAFLQLLRKHNTFIFELWILTRCQLEGLQSITQIMEL